MLWRVNNGEAERKLAEELQVVMQEIKAAQHELFVAERTFHQALNSDEVEYAIYNLSAAEKKLDMLLRRARLLWRRGDQPEGGVQG